MAINTRNPKINHAKFVVKNLKTEGKLPFVDVLSEKAINKHIKNISYRERIFSPLVTIFTFLSQVISQDQSCQGALAQVIAFFVSKKKAVPSANTAAYCKARRRLPEKIISGLAKECGQQLEAGADAKILWRGKHVKLVDGSTISMPDTLKNQMAYQQPNTQKDGVGFPIARVVAIISLAVGAVIDLAVGPYAGKGTGEHALLRQLLYNFNPGDVVLGDNYYASFFLMAMLMNMGVNAVFPIHSARNYDFRCGKRLGKKDHLIQWKKPTRPSWLDEETYKNFPDSITVREVATSSTCAGFRAKTRVIVTTFLNPKEVSKKDLGELYSQRWLVEINLRSIKETMHMDIMRGKTPEIVRKEIWMHLLAYNLVRKIMAQAASCYDRKPQELSFKLALQIIFAFRQARIFSGKESDAYYQLLKAIAYKRVGNRPGRIEPRAVKRRPKAFPKLVMARCLYRKNTICRSLS